MQFLQLIDFFIGDCFQQNRDLFQKVRLLVGATLSFQFSAVFFGIIYAFIPGITGSAIIAYAGIAVPAFILWVFILKLLKEGKHYELAAHTVIASTASVLFAGVCVTGGPMLTEVHPLLMVLVLFSFLLIGQRGGILWSLIVFLIYYILVAMVLSGIQLPNFAPENSRGFLRIFNWSLAFLVIATLVFMHDSLINRVIKQRDEERQKFKHIAKVAVDTSVVSKSADILADTGERLLVAAIQQKTAVEELAATTEELSATAEQNSALSSSAKLAIKDTEDHLHISKADILQLVSSMRIIKESSEEIQTINNVINDISYQTNILSLNAMIEASRSTEASGGFKVVALEVKRLAERSAKAAETINKLLETNRQSVVSGVNLSATMKQRFEEISARISPLSLSIQNVADASYEQSESIRQITLGLNNIDKAIEENQHMAQSSSKTARELHDSASSLQKMVDEFGLNL